MIIGRDSNSCFRHSYDSKNEETGLVGLMYHMAIQLSSDAFPKLFAPISLIYQNPSALKDMYFPTIVENILLLSNITPKEDAGRWKLCNKGHLYFVKVIYFVMSSYKFKTLNIIIISKILTFPTNNFYTGFTFC